MSKRNGNKSRKFLSSFLIFLLMVFASLSGIYCAKVFTTPYSSDILSMFDDDTLDDVEISKDKCNILILGTDKSGSLTDVMMLAQVDPESKKVSVLSIPRDTRIKFRGSWMKINAAHATGEKKGKNGGSEAAIIAVKELTGIPIHHFVKVNFDAFKKSIDALGGVDFDVPQRMKYTDPYQDLYIDLQKGMQHLDGDKAEQLVRFRRYKFGDIDRIKVQQDFLHALVEQKLNIKYVGKIDDIFRIISSDMETSMTLNDSLKLGKQLLSIGKDNIATYTLPNTPQDINKISYVIPNTSEIKALITDVFGYDDTVSE